MKKSYLWLFGILCLIPVCVWAWGMVGVGSIPPSACSISDDFSGDLSKWTVVYGDWEIDGGALRTTTNYKRTRINYTACAPTGNDQWVKYKTIADNNDYVGAVFRSSATGNCYAVYGALAQTWYWEVIDAAGNKVGDTVDSGTLAFATTNTIGIHVSGSDTSTTVEIWVNPAGAAPSNWGAAGLTLTGDPGTVVNSGDYVGASIYTSNGAEYLDDFTGGHE